MPTQDFDFKTKEIQSNISEERYRNDSVFQRENNRRGYVPSCAIEFTNMRIMLSNIKSTFVSTVSKFKTTKPKSIYVLS